MRALVLVGGEGTRLRPLTFTSPKPLLSIVNQAFLERQLTWLAAYGVDEVVLSLGYLPDAFVEHFPEGRFGDVRLRYAVEAEPLGTAGAVRFAAARADALDERLIVCNGDVLTDLDLGALVALHDDRGAAATITLAHVEDPSAFGVVPTRADGEVVAFVEKPPRDQAPTNWINAGTYVLEPEVLAGVPEGRRVSIERETFPALLEEPKRLYAMEAEAYWIDIGTPAKYLLAHADVAVGRLGLPPAPGARECAPGIWVQDETDQNPAAELRSPVVLGPGVVLANGSRVARSTLGPGVAVSSQATIEDSVVLGGAVIDEGARVQGSIVGPGARIGRGAVIAGESVVGAEVEIPADAELVTQRVPAPTD